jgi:hypothetical protein
VPEHVVKWIASWTGNYPEPFEAVVNLWIRQGRPTPTTTVQAELKREARRALRRFVKWIDPGESSVYRDALLSLEVDPNEHEAVLRLTQHPWRRVLMKNGRIRANQLASAVVAEYLQPAGTNNHPRVSDIELWAKGAALYRGWKFALAQKLLALRCEAGAMSNYLAVLALHAQVMAELYGGEAEAPMTDCSWDAACISLRKALGQIVELRLEDEHEKRLRERYEELLRFCTAVQKARKANARVVDVLLGIRGGNGSADRRIAVTLLAAHLAYDDRIAGDTLACQAALPLLEQLFRAWAFVALGLNYYAAPAGLEEIWERIAIHFDGNIRRPQPETEFTSFESFAYFAIALHEYRHPEQKEQRPEGDCRALERSLGVLELRRDLAHALSVVNPKLRKNFFEISNRWLSCLFRCDATMGTREELLMTIEPLQLINPEGVFV